jgi:hypothetical protein
MLGRHVYRVSPLDSGAWSVCKEGEAAPRGSHPTREAAARHAWELAQADEPSKVVIEERSGAIVDERLFGADTALELERSLAAEPVKPKREPPSRR